MTLETTLERIATALERIADLDAGRNLLLEQNTPAAEAADAAVEKARTRGRARKAQPEAPQDAETPTTPAAEQVKAEVAPEPAADPAPEPAKEAAAPAPEAAPVSTAPSVVDLQSRAGVLSPKYGKEKIVGLIKKFNPTGSNISTMSDEGRAGMWAALDALELGVAADPEFA